jgi:plasmid maintenance system antidote protein VapI
MLVEEFMKPMGLTQQALAASVDFWLKLQLACDLFDVLHSPKAKAIAKVRRVNTAA